jgi:hypothetical protein
MNNIKKILLIIIAILLFVGGYFTGHYFKKNTVPSGYILVRKNTIDSLKNIKPEIKDTIIHKEIVIFTHSDFNYIPIPNTSYSFVSDSLINDSIYIIINDTIEGNIKKREIKYKPIIFSKTITKKEPYFVDNITYKEAKHCVYGFIDIQVGGNVNCFMSGINLGIINKKNNKIAIGIASDFENKYLMFSYGKAFKIK